MLTAEDNERLVRVGANSAMGPVLRRYWVPIMMSRELEAGGAPKRARVFGESLVAFRGEDGVVGVQDEYCPHRGASLALGRIEGCALRCLYHGWLVHRDGTILETPPEPETSRFKEKFKQVVYASHEAGGMVWAYLGSPPQDAPPFPEFEWRDLPDEHVLVNRSIMECNWVQVLEGVIDSAHINSLHSTDIKPSSRTAVVGGATEYTGEGAVIERPSDDVRPRLEIEDTPYGFRYAALRKPLVDPESNQYIRVSHYVFPNFGFFPAPKGFGNLVIPVPVDDVTTTFYFVRYNFQEPLSEQLRTTLTARSGFAIGVDLDENFRNFRNARNNWLQDRERMRRGESFTGIDGITNQDAAVQESMGPIYDRTREHLGTSDMAVIRMRRQLLAAARAVAEGRLDDLPRHADAGLDTVRAFECVAPLTTSWRDLSTPEARMALGAEAGS